MEKPSAKNLAPQLHQVSKKALMLTKKLITVVWLSIKRLHGQMNAFQQVSPFEIFSMKKPSAKNPAPNYFKSAIKP